jgi:ADP-ribose pyrophosphatase YjhB (NUDIX family)
MTNDDQHPVDPRSLDSGFFRFCPDCGSSLESVEIHGQLRPRCPLCSFVQWRNPGVGVAGIVTENEVVHLLGEQATRAGVEDPSWNPAPGEGRVLLVRRRASRHPGWCLPCGWVEHDEEIRSALVRELREETGLEVLPGPVFAVHSNFHDRDRQSVGIWFRVTPVGGTLCPGDDADRIGFFRPDRVSAPLAFPTDRLVLTAIASSGP